MTRPLVLLLYESLYPGSHLVNRLEDCGYRVQTLADPGSLIAQAESEKPLLVLDQLEPRRQAACEAITRMKRNGVTARIPVIAITGTGQEEAGETAWEAGARLVVGDHAILAHLDQFLEQALEV
jgi:CheY-like chemotaxis protein